MKISLSVITFCILLFISCANERKSESISPATTSTAPVDITTPAAVQPTITPAPAAPTFNVVTPAAGTAALNPAHGQPGHRCDIAVGAPLNSAPTNTAGSTPLGTAPTSPQLGRPAPLGTQASTLAAPPQSVLSAPTGTAAGLNPAHGQPGHDCSIAVGAPLKK